MCGGALALSLLREVFKWRAVHVPASVVRPAPAGLGDGAGGDVRMRGRSKRCHAVPPRLWHRFRESPGRPTARQRGLQETGRDFYWERKTAICPSALKPANASISQHSLPQMDPPTSPIYQFQLCNLVRFWHRTQTLPVDPLFALGSVHSPKFGGNHWPAVRII